MRRWWQHAGRCRHAYLVGAVPQPHRRNVARHDERVLVRHVQQHGGVQLCAHAAGVRTTIAAARSQGVCARTVFGKQLEYRVARSGSRMRAVMFRMRASTASDTNLRAGRAAQWAAKRARSTHAVAHLRSCTGGLPSGSLDAPAATSTAALNASKRMNGLQGVGRIAESAVHPQEWEQLVLCVQPGSPIVPYRGANHALAAPAWSPFPAGVAAALVPPARVAWFMPWITQRRRQECRASCEWSLRTKPTSAST